MPLAVFGSTASRGRFAAASLRALEIALVLLIVGWSFRWSTRPGKGLLDYGSFIASGEAANQGLDPYGVYKLTFRAGPERLPAPNLNPPVSVYAFRLLARFEPTRTAAAWYVVSLSGFIVTVLLLTWAYPQQPRHAGIWSFALGGLWHTLELGQIYVPLLFCAACGWLLLRKGDDWRAGLPLGVIAAIKPQFALWPLLLVCSRNWRSGTTGLATAVVLSALPLLEDGWRIYFQWFAVDPPPHTLAGNSSIVAVASRVGADALGAVVTAVLVVFTIGFAWRAKLTAIQASGLSLAIAVLVGPFSWAGYTLLLLPVLFAAGWRAVMPAVVFLAFPFWVVIPLSDEAQPVAFLASSVYFLGVLVLVAILWRHKRLEPRPVSSAPQASRTYLPDERAARHGAEPAGALR